MEAILWVLGGALSIFALLGVGGTVLEARKRRKWKSDWLAGGETLADPELCGDDIGCLLSIYANEDVRPQDRLKSIQLLVERGEAVVPVLIAELRKAANSDWKRASYTLAAIGSLGHSAASAEDVIRDLCRRADEEQEDFFGLEAKETLELIGSDWRVAGVETFFPWDKSNSDEGPWEFLSCRLAVLCGLKHPMLSFGARNIARQKGLIK
jgi:hypothetical protein